MRLERLEVRGFGRLSDVAVDFSPSITVVTGPNEAGKSTVQRAIRAALYGLDAGGQGRPIERSDWYRWQPWSSGAYGVALTYELGDGRRFRVARTLDQREAAVQVHELGGGDVTDRLRAGRAVSPGLFHLGVDEAVFCATACLGEGGLRGDSGECAAQHVERVQEALERLADSGGGVSAAQALARLREAAQRVGSERRSGSPLGATVARLRQVETDLGDARRRAASVAGEQERLRQLEDQAAAAERRRLEHEREWLVGRLAALARQDAELRSACDEAVALGEDVEATASAAGFPIEHEERVLSLASELGAVAEADVDAARRAEEARARLRVVDRRRAEIAAGRRLLAGSVEVPDAALQAAERLRERLAEEASVSRRAGEVQALEARCTALKRELAATGLGSVPVGGAPAVADLLVAAAGGRQHSAERIGGLVAVAGGLAAGVGVAGGHRLLAAGAAAVALAVIVTLVVVSRLAGRHRHAARRELRRRCPGLELGDAAVRRHLERIDAVSELHTELQRQEVLLEAGRADLDAGRDRIAALAAEAREVALSAGVPHAAPAEHVTTDRLLAGARAAVVAVQEAAARSRRLAELAAEDSALGVEIRTLSAVIDEAERRAQQRAVLEAKLRRLLEEAGIHSWDDEDEAVQRFRARCEERRRHDTAAAALAEVQRRIQALGGDSAPLDRLRTTLTRTLVDRGGDPSAVATAHPLDAEALQRLEVEVDAARRAAARLRGEADGLRARISGLLDGLPSVADLEDERHVLLGAREQQLHQLAALQRAMSLIEEATRGVHRQVAPRLAEFLRERLALLSGGRWRDANVDTDRFAVSLLGDDRTEFVPLELLSHGTRDQVWLLLRMALCEVLGEGGEPAPLLLDEPVLTADPQRRRALVDFVVRLSVTHQVVVTAADPAVVEELGDAAGRHCRVVELPGPRATVTGRGALRRLSRR